MKRILIAIAASALMASAAHAAFDVTVDVDNTSYGVGDLLTINLTVATQGDHDVPAFNTIEYQAWWDPAIYTVANEPSGVSPNGHSTQTVFPELDAQPNAACFNPGTGGGPAGTDACVTFSQFNDGNGMFQTVTINGVQTAQLILEIIGGAGTFVADSLSIGQEIGQAAASITVGGNYGVATIVPEPTTAALIGLGLIGLGVAGRRR